MGAPEQAATRQRWAGPWRVRGWRGALPGAALVLATLLAVGSCGPDRRNEALGPGGDKIDEPLAGNAETFTLSASGGQACALPLKVKINPSNLTKVAGGLNVNGSIWGETGDYGTQRFANGNFHLVTDPNDPSRIVDVTGDGAALIPLIGAYAEFVPNLAGLRATFGVRKGSELQYLDVPVADDDKCYFLASLKGADLGFQASGKDFEFSVVSTYLVVDPSDPLVYFLGKLTRVPFLIEGTGLTKVAMAISAGGNLESTARAIPDKIVSGHLYFAATYQVGRAATISGDVFVRFPNFGAPEPQFVVSVEGSLFLAGQIVTTALSAVVPGFTSETLHVGDGTVITSVPAGRQGGFVYPLPGARIEFAVETADLMQNLTQLVGLDHVITGHSVTRVSGFVDTSPANFAIFLEEDVSVSVTGALGISLKEKIGVQQSPASAYFRLEGGVDIVVASVNVSGDIDVLAPSFNITGSVGVNATIAGTGFEGGVSITMAYPAGFTAALDLEICVAGICDGVGGSVTIGSDPEFCVDGLGCLP